MPDQTVNEARAILSRTFSDLARLADGNSAVRSVLEKLGATIGPDGAVNGQASGTRRSASKRGSAGSRAAGKTKAGTASRARTTTKTGARSRTSGTTKTTAASQRRPSATRKPARRGNPAARTSGRVTRKDQMLAIIRRQPGITIAAVAKELSVAPTGLYPVARRLETDKQIKKIATGWHPVRTS